VSPDGRWRAWPEGQTVRLQEDPEPAGAALRARAESEATLTWHAALADSAWQSGNAFATAFHLDALIAASPEVASLYIRRARARAQLGRTTEALADLRQPSLRASQNPEFLAACARACLAEGDLAGHRAACALLLKEPGSGPAVLLSVWTC